MASETQCGTNEVPMAVAPTPTNEAFQMAPAASNLPSIEGYPPAGYLYPTPGYPPQGYPYPPPGYPPQGYPPQQGYPQQGYPPPPVYAPQYQQPPPQQQSSIVGYMEGCLAALCCSCSWMPAFDERQYCCK